jgi:hypothetical protein
LTTVKEAVDQYIQLGKDLKELEAKRERMKVLLLKHLIKKDAPKPTVNGTEMSVSLTQSTSTTVDVDYLEDVLSPKLLDEVTSRHIDINSFRHKVQIGEIPMDVANKASKISKNKPYLTVGKLI